MGLLEQLGLIRLFGLMGLLGLIGLLFFLDFFFLGLLFFSCFFSLDFLGLFFWLIGFFVFGDLKVILGEFGGDWGFFCDFLDFFADFLLVACGGLSFFILLLWLGLLYQLF